MLQPHAPPVPPPILHLVHCPQPPRQRNRHCARHDNRNLRRLVLGRVSLPERLGPDDVPQAKAHQQHGVHDNLLRVPGGVGCDPAVEQRQGGADAVGHVVADELAGFVVGGEVGHEDGAEHAGEEEHGDAEGALVVAAGDVGSGDNGNDGDGAGGDGEEGGLLGGVAEAGIVSLDVRVWEGMEVGFTL